MIIFSELLQKASSLPLIIKTCYGIRGNKYITRNTLADLIDNTYCPKWKGATAGIGFGSYLPNTPETVEIGISGDTSAKGIPSVEGMILYSHHAGLLCG